METGCMHYGATTCALSRLASDRKPVGVAGEILRRIVSVSGAAGGCAVAQGAEPIVLPTPEGSKPPAGIVEEIVRTGRPASSHGDGPSWAGEPLRVAGSVIGAVVLSPATSIARTDGRLGEHLQVLLDLLAMTLHVCHGCRNDPPDREKQATAAGKPTSDDPFPEFVGRSAARQKLVRDIVAAADRPAPVLITGDTGNGKELAACALHRLGPRAGKLMFIQSVANIPDSVATSELFGHVEGSFTGARRSRPGLFRAHDGGTAGLDEIGDATPGLQNSIMRVADTGEIRSLGSDRVEKVDVRVIAMTCRDLEDLVERGAFREDLFFRLCGIHIEVPSLDERPEDIPLLVAHLLKKHRIVLHLPPGGMERLVEARWRGGVRELHHFLENLAASTGPEPTLWMVELALARRPLTRVRSQAREGEKLTKAKALAAWAQSGGSMKKAAQIARVTPDHLRRFARENDLAIGRGESSDPAE